MSANYTPESRKYGQWYASQWGATGMWCAVRDQEDDDDFYQQAPGAFYKEENAARYAATLNACAGYADPMDLRREAYCARNAESVSTRYTEGRGWTRFFHFAEGTTKTIGVHIHQGALDWERSGSARAAVDALMEADHE